MSKFVEGPLKPMRDADPMAKGSPGEYNGDPCAGLPKRTPTPNGPPEKTFDEAMPKVPKGDFFKP